LTENEIPNPTGGSKLHTSVIRGELPEEHWVEKDISHLRKKSFKATELAIFDTFSKRYQMMKKCLVVKLDAKYLVQLHTDLLKRGGTYNHPVYHPHITLSYDFPADFDLSTLSVPKFTFQPHRIFTADF
jgi:hypothetical protein